MGKLSKIVADRVNVSIGVIETPILDYEHVGLQDFAVIRVENKSLVNTFNGKVQFSDRPTGVPDDFDVLAFQNLGPGKSRIRRFATEYLGHIRFVGVMTPLTDSIDVSLTTGWETKS